MAEVQNFTPIDYDAENIPPDAPPGAWRATATSKVSKTSKDSYPMVIVEWELDTAYEEENESFVGARVADFITFFPETRAQASRMSKVRLKTFCDKLGISRTLIPKHIATSDDLAEFCAAIDGQQADIWTAVDKQDQGNGEVIERVKVFYKAPGGIAASGALPPVETDEPEDEEEPDEPEEEEEPEAKATPLRAVSTAPKTGVKGKTAPAAGKKAAGRR
jgi:hypothetical protein